MKTVRALLAALPGMLLSTPAVAGDLVYADLPLGQVAPPPVKRVRFVGPRESVPGISIVPIRPEPARNMVVTADPVSAAALRANTPRPPGLASTCLAEIRRDGVTENDPLASLEWSADLSTEVDAHPKSSQIPSSGMIAVHAERVVEGKGTATLEMTDAWIDPATRGARLIAKRTMPLKLVRGPFFGLTVYAGREEHADGKKLVQFVVVQARASEVDRSGRTVHLAARRQDGVVSHSTGCAHHRVALQVEPRSGSSAIVTGAALLASSTPSPMGEGRELRTREIDVQLSVSQTSSDKSPLVSVSAAWGGREIVDRLSSAEPDPS